MPKRAALTKRDPNVPAAAAPAAAVPGAKEIRAGRGRSMSALLQSRSETAVQERRISAPASPMPDIDSEDKVGAALFDVRYSTAAPAILLPLFKPASPIPDAKP